MGKGDRKTAKGKRYSASYGNARPHGTVKKTAAVKKATPAATKAPAKKTAAPAKKKA
jgi:30S ribosomal protein S31